MKLGLSNTFLHPFSGQAFPTADLTCLLTMATYESEGTTYYVNSKGNDVPVVGELNGLDTILDFSVLNDVRLDKSNTTYWGATLNAYFYNDPANPYHYKLKDFHYKFFNAQVTFGNTCFLKANATSATNNVIESVSALAIYSVEQVDRLSYLKTLIGIKPYFESKNLVINGTFDSETGWTLGTGWSILNGKLIATAIGDFAQAYQELDFAAGESYRTKITMSDDAGGTFRLSLAGNFPAATMKSNAVYEQNIAINSVSVNRFWVQGYVTGTAKFDDFQIYQRFEDYYNSVATDVNVLDFGAVMDGTTNNYQAIIDAYAEYVSTNRLSVYIPTGNFGLSTFSILGSDIDNLTENVIFKGDGIESRILRVADVSTSLFSLAYCNNINIQSLLFDRNNLGDRSCFGVSRSSNVYLNDVHFKNGINSLCALYSNKNLVLENFSLINTQDNGSAGNHGLDIDMYDYSTAEIDFIPNNYIVRNGYINNFGRDACKIENIDGFLFSNITCYGQVYCYDDDRRLANVRNITYSGNTFHKNADPDSPSDNTIRVGTQIRDGNFLITGNTFVDIPLIGSIKLTDVFWGVSITHDASNDEITITDIVIGNSAVDLVGLTMFDIINILNVGDTFTLPDATGFSTLEFEVTELLSATSLKASITTSPTQITALTDVDVTYTRLKNPTIEITGNTFPDKSYISDELKAVANIHDNIYLDGDSD